MPDGAVVALDVGVMLAMAGLDVLDGNAPTRGPDQQLATGLFRAVLYPYCAGLAAPLDDRVKASDDPLCWQREVDLEAQSFAVEVIQHVQQSKLAAIAEAISHEIPRLGQVGRVWHGQGVMFIALQSLAGFDAQVKLQRAIDPIDPLVIPTVPLDVAQVQETQGEPPGLAGIGQPGQQIGDLDGQVAFLDVQIGPERCKSSALVTTRPAFECS